MTKNFFCKIEIFVLLLLDFDSDHTYIRQAGSDMAYLYSLANW